MKDPTCCIPQWKSQYYPCWKSHKINFLSSILISIVEYDLTKFVIIHNLHENWSKVSFFFLGMDTFLPRFYGHHAWTKAVFRHTFVTLKFTVIWIHDSHLAPTIPEEKKPWKILTFGSSKEMAENLCNWCQTLRI